MHRFKLVHEHALPVVEHVADRHPVGDAEGEVQVGEAVALANRERADKGARNDALIVFRQAHQAVAKSLPLPTREHDARS